MAPTSTEVLGRECEKAMARSRATLGLALACLLCACNSTTVFQAAFSSAAVNSPPAHAQATGTINLDGAAGSVQVVSAPPNVTGNWARITRTSSQTSLTAMQCDFASFNGAGTYNLLATIYMPTGTQTSTLQFETFGQAPSDYKSFLHLDFMPNNQVRINDDDATAFGSFPRDQSFVVEVTWTITSSSANAHIQLLGGTATGSADHAAEPLAFAEQFGAVRFWMGYPWTGSFYVSDVIVTRQNE